ncbi:hypothetical protein ABK040_006796 [Willaertia magna]
MEKSTKSNFSFPIPPYDIQLEFMKKLYDTIENNNIGIFESPTGTGKTLSLICGCLTWLEDFYKQKSTPTEEENGSKRKKDEDSDDEPEWIMEQVKKQKQEEEEQKLGQLKNKSLKKVENYEKKRNKFLQSITNKMNSEDDDDLVLKEVDDETKHKIINQLGIKKDILDDLYSDDEEESEILFGSRNATPKEEEDTFLTPKIIFCSRTHSQLNQFVNELRKTSFKDKVRMVNLASRQTYCINEYVLYKKTNQGKVLNSSSRINEQCQYFREKKYCCYDAEDLSLFKDHVMVKVHDIEELIQLGKRLEICPYYGTRRAVPSCELVCLPYSSLLHEQTRKSLGIQSLKDCIIIIDEAHNLVNAIHQTLSCQLELMELQLVQEKLEKYLEKFKNRLSGKNQSNMKKLMDIVNKMANYLKNCKKENGQEFVLSVNEFLFETKLDNVNLFEVTEFIEKSELTKKLNLFIERQEKSSVVIHTNKTTKRNNNGNHVQYSANKQKQEEDHSRLNIPVMSNNAMFNFASMLLALMNIDKDGKLLISPNKSMKFMLLNPNIYFESIVKEAKSIILAGGTLEPIQTLLEQLFPNNVRSLSNISSNNKGEKLNDEAKSIVVYQCDHHIIPKNQFLPLILTKGPNNIDFDFRFQSRKNEELISSLGMLILNLSNIVPDGIVLFFPSYQYEKLVFEHWQKSGIITSIEKKKKFLREASTLSNNSDSHNPITLEQLLQDYKQTIDFNFGNNNGGSIQRYNGSVLSSIVGGKLSEGINFSDGYGRLVVVVGMPYPNPNDIELLEQQKYFSNRFGHTSNTFASEFYDNICMNAVNQSIGRAIRHAKDYASILLLDKRYQQQKMIDKLSKWIRKDITTEDNFGKILFKMGQFFKEKLTTQQEFERVRKENFISKTNNKVK